MKKLTLILFAIIASISLSFSQKFMNKTTEFTAISVSMYETETSELIEKTDCKIPVTISKKTISIFAESQQLYTLHQFINERKIEDMGKAKYWYATIGENGLCQIGICRYDKDKNYYFLSTTYADYMWIYTLQIKKK